MQGDRPSLTLNEVRVARLVAEGRSDDEIAGQLAMRVDEVDAAVAAALSKLALRSRTELALLLPPIGGELPRAERAHQAHPR
jgi:DNA-binding NarL/FixJ family response regulator